MFQQPASGKGLGIISTMFFLALWGCTSIPQATTGGGAWKSGNGGLQLERDALNGSVTRLEGELLPRGSTAGQSVQEAAKMVLATHRSTLLIRDPDSEFRLVAVKRDQLGYTHLRFAQEYRGVPVWQAVLDIHFDARQRPYLLSGAYFPTPERFDTSGEMDEGAALQAAARFDPRVTAAAYDTRKVIFFRNARTPVMALELKPKGRALLGGTAYVVDAGSGEILHRSPTMHPSRRHP